MTREEEVALAEEVKRWKSLDKMHRRDVGCELEALASAAGMSVTVGEWAKHHRLIIDPYR